jgi:hypothetical protein
MVSPRAYHTATLLESKSGSLAGQVLLAGGRSLLGAPKVVDTAQIFDPTTAQFGQPIQFSQPCQPAQSGQMGLPCGRFRHTATTLADGNVLLAGGIDSSGQSLGTTEIYDAKMKTFGSATPLTVPRDSVTATSIGVGRVLIAGGEQIRAGNSVPLDSAEIYDSSASPPGFVCVGGTSGSPAACNSSMKVARLLHTATLLRQQNVVLIAGGLTAGISGGTVPTASAEIFTPAAGRAQGSFALIAPMAKPRVGHTATYLDPTIVKSGSLSGDVLLVGGADDLTAELYDPNSGSFRFVKNDMNAVHRFHAAVLLTDGRVLILGGGQPYADGSFVAEPIAEIFDPASETFVRTATGMLSARAMETATFLDPALVSGSLGGDVLIAGGETTNSVQAGAELYVPTDPGCITCSR